MTLHLDSLAKKSSSKKKKKNIPKTPAAVVPLEDDFPDGIPLFPGREPFKGSSWKKILVYDADRKGLQLKRERDVG